MGEICIKNEMEKLWYTRLFLNSQASMKNTNVSFYTAQVLITTFDKMA